MQSAIPESGTPRNNEFKGTAMLKPVIDKRESTNLLLKNNEKSALVSNLSRIIRSTWEVNRNAKRKIEERLLADLRAKNSEYDPETLRSIRAKGGSEIYMGLTSIKCRGAKSWIRDILMPAGDKPWGLSPTPIPDLPQWAEDAVIKRIQETSQQGDTREETIERLGKLRDMALDAIKKDAKERSKRMELKIEDQLAEAGFDEQFLEFIDDFCIFPAAIMKGPMPYKRKKLSWGEYENGFTPVSEDVIRIESKRVSPFDVYPSPQSSGINDGDFIEHIRLNRGELYALIGVSGYNEKEIRAALVDYSTGGLREWLWNETERQSLENKERLYDTGQNKTIDALHFWGNAQGSHLLEWGVPKSKVDDPQKEYQIDAIMVGSHVIRAVINNDPLGRRPYYKACLDPIPSAFWGNSLPKIIESEQRVCNATARALVNNVAMASGPMIEVFSDRLAPNETVSVEPWRIYQTIRGEGASVGSNGNIRFFQPDIHANELIAVYREFEQKADDSSMIPKYAYGDGTAGGAGATARGLSMLMNSASKGIKTGIAQIDLNMFRPMIEQYFYFNMVNDPDPLIKGDSSIIARGANALLIKEQSHAERLEFLQMTNNPIDQQIVGVEARADLLRETAKSLDMPSLIPEHDEFKRRIEENAAKQAQQPDPAQIEIEANMNMKKAELMAKAEESDKQREFDANQKKQDRIAAAAIESEKRMQHKLQSKPQIKPDNNDSEIRDKSIERLINKFDKLQSSIDEIKKLKEADKVYNLPPQNEKKTECKENGSTIINLSLDTKSGKIKKTIDVTKRDDKDNAKNIEVIEEQV